MAPEYFFKVNEKTDSYSLVCHYLHFWRDSLFLDGEYDTEAYYLVDWVRSCVEQNQVIKVVDKTMLEEKNWS